MASKSGMLSTRKLSILLHSISIPSAGWLVRHHSQMEIDAFDRSCSSRVGGCMGPDCQVIINFSVITMKQLSNGNSEVTCTVFQYLRKRYKSVNLGGKLLLKSQLYNPFIMTLVYSGFYRHKAQVTGHKAQNCCMHCKR